MLLPSGLLSFQDAGIHGFDVLHHQAEELVAEAEHELGKHGGRSEKACWRLLAGPSAADATHLLGDGEGLVVELLDELGGHLVRVVGGRVGALLLQEVDLDGHGADALLGLVEVVVGHCGDTQGPILRNPAKLNE